MKKCIIMIIYLLFVSQSLFSTPNIGSTDGLLRIISAEIERKGHCHLNLHLLITTDKLEMKYKSTDGEIYSIEDYYQLANLYFGIGYSVSNYVTLIVNSTFLEDYVFTISPKNSTRFLTPDDKNEFLGTKDMLSFGLGDTKLSFKFTYPAPQKGKLYIGLCPFISFPTGAQKAILDNKSDPIIQTGGIFRKYTSSKTEFGIIAPITFSLTGAKLHFNAGFYNRNGEGMIVDPDQVLLGAGVEFGKRFIPFCEFTTDKWINDKDGLLGPSPIRIASGFRITNPNGVNFDLAAEYRLSEENKKGTENNVASGWCSSPSLAIYCSLISYCFRPAIGDLYIKVIDGNTDKPLEATISFPESKLKEVKSNIKTGNVTIKDIPKGDIQVVIEKEGYLRKESSIKIKKSEITTYECRLFPDLIPKTGIITGRIIDSKTKEPIEATISLPQFKIEQKTTIPETGVFKVENIPIGIVIVEINKEGYLKQSATVEIKKQETTIKDFELTPIEKDIGTLTGNIVNVKDKSVIGGAKISFPGTQIKDVLSDATTGNYIVEEVPAGSIIMEISKEGFLKQTATVVIEKKKITIKDFALKSNVNQGTITGKVIDKKTGFPLPATIAFQDAGISPIICDHLSGIYKVTLAAGTYVMSITLDKYISQSWPVVIEEDKTIVKDIVIVKKGEIITLKGIYFAINKAIIKPESEPTLKKAADFLKENPQMRVEIQGHTDSTGNDALNQKLSEARSMAVKVYLVQKCGISPQQLVTKGYGESMPVASNATADGRSLNRRIDFLILGEVE